MLEETLGHGEGEGDMAMDDRLRRAERAYTQDPNSETLYHYNAALISSGQKAYLPVEHLQVLYANIASHLTNVSIGKNPPTTQGWYTYCDTPDAQGYSEIPQSCSTATLSIRISAYNVFGSEHQNAHLTITTTKYSNPLERHELEIYCDETFGHWNCSPTTYQQFRLSMSQPWVYSGEGVLEFCSTHWEGVAGILGVSSTPNARRNPTQEEEEEKRYWPWLEEKDALITEAFRGVGLGPQDMPDADWWGAYENGFTPKEAINILLGPLGHPDAILSNAMGFDDMARDLGMTEIELAGNLIRESVCDICSQVRNSHSICNNPQCDDFKQAVFCRHQCNPNHGRYRGNPVPEHVFSNWHVGGDILDDNYILYALTPEGQRELQRGLVDRPLPEWVLGEVKYNVPKDDNYVYINWIGVRKDLRRNKLGTALWAEMKRLYPGFIFPARGLSDKGAALRKSVGMRRHNPDWKWQFAWHCPSPPDLMDWQDKTSEDLEEYYDIIDYIKEHAEDMDFDEFLAEVGEQSFLETSWAGLDSDMIDLIREQEEKGGLHFGFFRSRYPDGTPVIYHNHSGIEHVWEPLDNGN